MKKVLYLAITALVLLGAIQPAHASLFEKKRTKKVALYTLGAAITTASAYLLGSHLAKNRHTSKPDNLIIAGSCALAFGSLWAAPNVVEWITQKIYLNAGKDKPFIPEQKEHTRSKSLESATPSQRQYVEREMRKMNNWPEQSIVIEKEEEKAQSPLSSRERPRTPPATYSPINQLGKQVKTKVQINAESAKKISFWLNLTGGIIGASAGFYATALKMSRT